MNGNETFSTRPDRAEAKPGVDWPGADLRHLDLTNADLRGAVLTNAKLPIALDGANFAEADLTGARALKASAAGVQFNRAKMGDADLSDSRLTGASFRDANLVGAILHGAHLDGADFIGADLSGADLSATDLNKASITAARNVTGLYLADAKGIGLEFLEEEEEDEFDADDEASSAETGDATIAVALQERGAGWGLDDLPYDIHCPSCNRYDTAELRRAYRDDDGYYDCDLCDGYGRMTPAELDARLGEDRLQCIWCGGGGWAGNYMPGSAAWACVVCWGTGKMPGWALAVNEVLMNTNLERNSYLEYDAEKITVDVTGLSAAGFVLSSIEFREGARFTDCDFHGASFADSTVPRATFTRCNLTGSDFTGAALAGTTFVDCTLVGSNVLEAEDLSNVSIVFGAAGEISSGSS